MSNMTKGETNVTLIKKYFGMGPEAMSEMKELTKDERGELGDLIRETL